MPITPMGAGDAAEAEAVRAGPFGEGAGERVGEGGDGFEAGGDGFDAGRGEEQAVAESAAAVEGGDVGLVGGQDGGCGGAQGCGHGAEAAVAAAVRAGGEQVRGGTRAAPGLTHPGGAVVGFVVHPGTSCRCVRCGARGELMGVRRAAWRGGVVLTLSLRFSRMIGRVIKG